MTTRSYIRCPHSVKARIEARWTSQHWTHVRGGEAVTTLLLLALKLPMIMIRRRSLRPAREFLAEPVIGLSLSNKRPTKQSHFSAQEYRPASK